MDLSSGAVCPFSVFGWFDARESTAFLHLQMWGTGMMALLALAVVFQAIFAQHPVGQVHVMHPSIGE